jgi:hypothetical protein
MSQTHEQIMTEIQTYSEENGKFTEKGLSKLIKARRKEIQEAKNAAKAA